jgi:hypothetical protein
MYLRLAGAGDAEREAGGEGGRSSGIGGGSVPMTWKKGEGRERAGMRESCLEMLEEEFPGPFPVGHEAGR